MAVNVFERADHWQQLCATEGVPVAVAIVVMLVGRAWVAGKMPLWEHQLLLACY